MDHLLLSHQEPHLILLIILPYLIALGALTAGIYSVLNPDSASRLYGISPQSLSPSVTKNNTSSWFNFQYPDLLTFLDSRTPDIPQNPNVDLATRPARACRTITLEQSHPDETKTQAEPDPKSELSTPASLTQTQTQVHSETRTQTQNPVRLPLHAPLATRNITTGLTILLITAHWHLSFPPPHHHGPTSTHIPIMHDQYHISQTLQSLLGLVVLTGSLVPCIDAWCCFTASAARDGRGGKAGWLHIGRGLVWVGTGVWLVWSARG